MDFWMDFHLPLLHVTPSLDEDEACCIEWAYEQTNGKDFGSLVCFLIITGSTEVQSEKQDEEGDTNEL